MISSVQSLSCVQPIVSLQPHGLQHTRPPCPSPTPGIYSNSCPSLVMPSNHLNLCHHLLLLPSVPHSIRVFSSESVACIRWPKCWSFSFNISPPNEYSALISFRMDWLDLLVVQGTLKSLLQHHSSKASILWCLAFFIVQFSQPYRTTGKTIVLTRWTFVGFCSYIELVCQLVQLYRAVGPLLTSELLILTLESLSSLWMIWVKVISAAFGY